MPFKIPSERRMSMSHKEKSRTFLSGVLILTVANLITKIIGLVFKIPLTNMLGNEGMGYFNTAYQIYTWLYMLSTAGVPVALSLMIAECRAKGRVATEKKLFGLTLIFFALIGLVGSVLMLIFCRGLASFISADLSYLCILAIAPALFFVCISSTIRGYFQGRRNMVPTAVSEIIEAVLKLSVGIALGFYALNKGFPLYKVAAYAIFGVTVGVCAGALFLVLSSMLSKHTVQDVEKLSEVSEEPQSGVKLLLSFFKIAVPVMLSSSLLSMASMLDTVIVIRRLQDIGIAENISVALYGNYTAYCVTLFNLPPVLIYPIVNTLIPSLAGARVNNDKGKISLFVQKSMKLSAIIALPCAIGLGVMSFPILKLIFTSVENARMAAPLLTCLAPSVFLIGIMAVSNGMLQAFKLQKYSVISMIFGAAVKAVGAFALPSVKLGGRYLGIYASPISTFLFYLTITCFNFYFLARHANVRISAAKVFLRPLICAILCGLSAVGVYILLVNLFGDIKIFALIAIGIGALVYGITLLLIGGINRSDIELIPTVSKAVGRISILDKIIKN